MSKGLEQLPLRVWFNRFGMYHFIRCILGIMGLEQSWMFGLSYKSFNSSAHEKNGFPCGLSPLKIQSAISFEIKLETGNHSYNGW